MSNYPSIAKPLQDKDIKIGKRLISRKKPVFIAGPCAVESKEQLLNIAKKLLKIGEELGILNQMMLRGGAWKPRTLASSFRGLGWEAVKYLDEAREITGMPYVTEVFSPEHVEELSRHADMLQIGSRNWENHELLIKVGKTNKPLLYKRGRFGCQLERWLAMAEFIAKEGNNNIVLCERGHESMLTGDYNRSSVDYDVFGAVHDRTCLPIIIDSSHGTGRQHLVPKATMSALRYFGADGCMVEVVDDSTNLSSVLCDSQQALKLSDYKAMLQQILSFYDN